MTRNHPIGAVLFDAVGTLLRPDPPVAEAYHRAGRRFGSLRTVDQIAQRFAEAFARAERADARELDARELDARELDAELQAESPRRRRTNPGRERQRWQRIVAEVFDDLPQAGPALFESLWEHFAQSRHWALYEDVEPTWRELNRRGVPVGIASNFDDRLLAICRGIPPLATCSDIFWSAAIGHPKPSLRFFQTVERKLGVPGKQILFVGDDLVNDYQGARAAGWQALWLDRRGNQGGPDTIHSLTQILER